MAHQTEQKKHALVIGINAYPNFTKFEQLKGCVNDARLMESVLKDRFGFPAENIDVLTDAAATRDGILSAMEALLERVGQDDIVVMHYSGHGSQMTDREGDEPDGKDETLVPHDSGRAPHPNREITDDEIYAWLNRITAKTPFLTLIFDCCHSGTISRDATGGRSRRVVPDTRPVEELPPSPVRGATTRSAVHETGPSGWLPLDKRYVLLAGCRDDELSKELLDEESDASNGALTFFLTRALTKATPGTTYRDVFEEASRLVTTKEPRQHPQIEGALDREVFGVHDIEPMSFVSVAGRDGETVELAAGAAHGLTVGSIWGIYTIGTKAVTDESERLGGVEVTKVGALSSTAGITEETSADAITAHCRAVVEAHAFGETGMNVSVISTTEFESEAKALRDLIEASELLRLVSPDEEADARAFALGPRESAGEDEPVQQLGRLNAAVWAVIGTDGKLIMPAHPLAETRVAATLRTNLELIARYQAALPIENPDPNSALRGAVELRLQRQDANGKWIDAEPEQAGGGVVFEADELLGIIATNNHEAPVFLHLLDFGLMWQLDTPNWGANVEVAPGESFRFGFREGEKLELYIPDGFPYVADPIDESPDSGEETFKLIVTTVPGDFSSLRQGSVRSMLSPLEELMRMRLTGSGTRQVRDPLQLAAVDDWTTVSRTIVLRRRTDGTPLNAEGGAVELDGVTLRTPGLSGQAKVLPAFSARTRSVDLVTDELELVFENEDVSILRTVELEHVDQVSTRSTSGEGPNIEVEAPDPGANLGQFVLYTDESGVTTWHFEEKDVPGTRGAAATRTYVIERAGPAPTSEAGTRGLVGSVGKKLIKLLVFPLIDPILGEVGDYFAGKWEAKNRPYGVRFMAPQNYGTPVENNLLDADQWTTLSRGKSLLFVHGTFSRAHSAFGGLSQETMEALHRQYGGRIFALDHFTLSDDPTQNVEWLLQQIPDSTSLDLDIICHSRGGLVSRVLAEKKSEFSLGSRSLKVGNVVFAASPNAGTALADAKHMGKLIDTYTNLLNFIPDNPVTDILDGVITVAKQLAVGAMKGLDGLESMLPGGPFQNELNTAVELENTRYFALGADYAPSEVGFRNWVTEQLTDAIFKADNDLVVPTASVYDQNGGSLFPIEDRKVFDAAAGISHTTFFQHPDVQAQLLTWLHA